MRAYFHSFIQLFGIIRLAVKTEGSFRRVLWKIRIRWIILGIDWDAHFFSWLSWIEFKKYTKKSEVCTTSQKEAEFV